VLLLISLTRRMAMIKNCKVAVLAVVAAVCLASPAFAQAFDADYGTGNSISTYYDSNGALHLGTASQRAQVAMQQKWIAPRRRGESAFAMLPVGANGSFDPSATGGGSIGYNKNLRADQW
jgi:opacity protein-like surface antigen